MTLKHRLSPAIRHPCNRQAPAQTATVPLLLQSKGSNPKTRTRKIFVEISKLEFEGIETTDLYTENMAEESKLAIQQNSSELEFEQNSHSLLSTEI